MQKMFRVKSNIQSVLTNDDRKPISENGVNKIAMATPPQKKRQIMLGNKKHE